MENCDRCQINAEKARLFDVIYEGKIGKLCERCAIIENIPVLKRPDGAQLKNSEKNIDVYERMKRMSGYKEEPKETQSFREKRLRELEKNPKLELPIKEQLNLMDHFHWEIMKNRRRKGLTQRQLADSIGESEIEIDMLEKGRLPENSENLIKKLEQFFQMSLRKISDSDVMVSRKQRMTRSKPVLLDEYGNELEHIPEPFIEEVKEIEDDIYFDSGEGDPQEEKEKKEKEIPWYKKILGKKKKEEIVEENLEENEETEEIPEREFDTSIPGSRYLSYRRKEQMSKKQPSVKLKEGEDLDLEKVDLGRVRISDLKEIHKKRVEATKSEKIQEQKNIEEKQRLIEARKEELRSIKEKESKNLDKVLGGSELMGKDKEEPKSKKGSEEKYF